MKKFDHTDFSPGKKFLKHFGEYNMKEQKISIPPIFCGREYVSLDYLIEKKNHIGRR